MTEGDGECPHCWAVLGLQPDTDARAVKRRYAVLLRATRPDEDPQGFQRLRGAYEEALKAINDHSSLDELRHKESPQSDREQVVKCFEVPVPDKDLWFDDASEWHQNLSELPDAVPGELETPGSSDPGAGERVSQIVSELIPDYPARALEESEQQGCRRLANDD